MFIYKISNRTSSLDLQTDLQNTISHESPLHAKGMQTTTLSPSLQKLCEADYTRKQNEKKYNDNIFSQDFNNQTLEKMSQKINSKFLLLTLFKIFS